MPNREPCWLCGDAHMCDECCVFVVHAESDSAYVEFVEDHQTPACALAEIVPMSVFERARDQWGYDISDFRKKT